MFDTSKNKVIKEHTSNMKMIAGHCRKKSKTIFSTVQFIPLKLIVYCKGAMLLYKAMVISFNKNEFQLSLSTSQRERQHNFVVFLNSYLKCIQTQAKIGWQVHDECFQNS